MIQPEFLKLNKETGLAEILCTSCLHHTELLKPNCLKCFKPIKPYTNDEFVLQRIEVLSLLEISSGESDKRVSILDRSVAKEQRSRFWLDLFRENWKHFEGIMSDGQFLNSLSIVRGWDEWTGRHALELFPLSPHETKTYSHYSSQSIAEPISRLRAIAESSPVQVHMWLAKVLLSREACDLDYATQKNWDELIFGRESWGGIEIEDPLHAEIMLSHFHWTYQLVHNRKSERWKKIEARETLGRRLTVWNPRSSHLRAWKTLGLALCGLPVDPMNNEPGFHAEYQANRELAISYQISRGQSPTLSVEEAVENLRWGPLVEKVDNANFRLRVFELAPEKVVANLLEHFDFAAKPATLHIVVNRMIEKSLPEKMLSRVEYWAHRVPNEDTVEICRKAANGGLDRLVRACFQYGEFQPTEELWSELQGYLSAHRDLYDFILQNHSRYKTLPDFDWDLMVDPGSGQHQNGAIQYARQYLEERPDRFARFWIWLDTWRDKFPAETLDRLTYLIRREHKIEWNAETFAVFARFLGDERFTKNPPFTDWILEQASEGASLKGLASHPEVHREWIEELFTLLTGERASRGANYFGKLLCAIPFDEELFGPYRKTLEDFPNPSGDMYYYINSLLERFPEVAEIPKALPIANKLTELGNWFQAEIMKIQMSGEAPDVKAKRMHELGAEYQRKMLELQSASG
ncbi:MAG: hypothetical protein ABL958_07225 [Bdellovibrionia bacterium]